MSLHLDRFVHSARLVFASTVLALAGMPACGASDALENRPCPCASGWTCCADQNVCVAAGGACPSPDAVAHSPDAAAPRADAGAGLDASLTCEARTERTAWGAEITYLGPVEAGPVQAGQPLHLRYAITGNTSGVSDRILVRGIEGNRLAGSQEWGMTVTNVDGSAPFDLVLGETKRTTELLVRVDPPNVAGAETFIAIQATPCALGSNMKTSTVHRLRVGETPRAGETDVRIDFLTGSFTRYPDWPLFFDPNNMNPAVTFGISNTSSEMRAVDFRIDVYSKLPASGADWEIHQDSYPTGAMNVPVAPRSQTQASFRFTIPTDGAARFATVLRVVDSGSKELLAEAYFPMEKK